MSDLNFLLEEDHQKVSTFNKIVVRRLPPNLTLKIFKEHVFPLPSHNYMYFVPAGKDEHIYSFSRVYINFVHHEDIYAFKQKYDNYVFIGPRGKKYYAVVEFAPYQDVPKNRLFENNNAKQETIQENMYFQQFLKNLKMVNIHENTEYDFQLNLPNHRAMITTPLLKYVSTKRSEQTNGRLERKKDTKQLRPGNCLVFVNSSVKKCGILNLKRYS